MLRAVRVMYTCETVTKGGRTCYMDLHGEAGGPAGGGDVCVGTYQACAVQARRAPPGCPARERVPQRTPHASSLCLLQPQPRPWPRPLSQPRSQPCPSGPIGSQPRPPLDPEGGLPRVTSRREGGSEGGLPRVTCRRRLPLSHAHTHAPLACAPTAHTLWRSWRSWPVTGALVAGSRSARPSVLTHAPQSEARPSVTQGRW